MRKFIILAQSELTANALSRWLEIVEGSLAPVDTQRIIWKEASWETDSSVEQYELLVRQVERACKGENGRFPLNEVVVLVDAVKPMELSAIHERCSWNHLLALLILSFPEVHWVFGALDNCKSFPEGHTLENLSRDCQRDPILDPTGLRDWVRTQTTKNLEETDDLKLVGRERRAVAIDEERHYAYLNAYTAYRFGCRADIVTTWALMKEFFGSSDPEPSSHGYWLLLEDMSLNFADKPNNIHLLRLDEYHDEYHDEGIEKVPGRASWCRKLNSQDKTAESSTYRVMITTGQARDDSTLGDNQTYLSATKGNNGKWVFKPSKGIFGLWHEAHLLPGQSRLRNSHDASLNFDWPPRLPAANPTFRKFLPFFKRRRHQGHGSPGKLMLVVNTLIRRARELLASANSVEVAIQGAVLTTDALELTGGRTPTSAVDALTLKHRFEVLAECQFSGVAHQINTKWRWKEIEVETESISRWFQPNEMSKANLNARMHVLNTLVRVFREHNKFDEEQQCMIRARNVHNSLWLKRRRYRFLFIPLLRYFELLMRSVSWFLFCLLIWVLFFGFAFMWSANYPTYSHGLFDSISSILAISPPASNQARPADIEVFSLYAVAVCGAILTGVAHLGVFISHLYAIVSRK